MQTLTETLTALKTATIEDKLVYTVEGWRDEYGRGRHVVGHALDQTTARYMARGKGFYCDGDIKSKVQPVVTLADGTMSLVTITMSEVMPDVLTIEERKKKELQDKALAKLTQEEREALGL